MEGFEHIIIPIELLHVIIKTQETIFLLFRFAPELSRNTMVQDEIFFAHTWADILLADRSTCR